MKIAWLGQLTSTNHCHRLTELWYNRYINGVAMGDLEAIHVSTAWFPLTKLMHLLLLPNVQSVRNIEQCLIWPYPLRSPTSHLVASWLQCYKGQQFILTWKNNIPGFAFPACRASNGTIICNWGLRVSTDRDSTSHPVTSRDLLYANGGAPEGTWQWDILTSHI